MPTGYIICSTDGSAYEKGRFLVNKRKTIISVVCILLALVLIAGAIAYGVSPGRHSCKPCNGRAKSVSRNLYALIITLASGRVFSDYK